jgi:hypothetical protein
MAQTQVQQLKLKATAAILTTYIHNRIRLMAELAKQPRDRSTLNSIRAYLHIVRSLEDNYDLSPLMAPHAVGEGL